MNNSILHHIHYLKKSMLFLCLLFLNFLSLHAQENVKRKQLFDDDWRFFLGEETKASSDNFNDKDWRKLDLPHDWSIEGKVHPKNTTGAGGGYFPAGVAWYRKTFMVPDSWKTKKTAIYFEGVYMNSEVFINGKSLGVYPYGYSSFSYDLSPHLKYGEQNVIAVRVDNSQQMNSRWYSGSGIYRHVWLIHTDPVHIAQWGTGISTFEISPKKATVRVETKVINETESLQEITVTALIQNPNSNTAGHQETKVALSPKSEKVVTQLIKVSNPALWSPLQPFLYKALIKVSKQKKILDESIVDFGIRSLKFTVENGFQLNGKTIKLNGGCVHHDNGSLGAAAFDRAEQRKVELLKASGFNAVRTSHNPPSEAFLDACDRLGLLVMDESFDCWKIGKNKYDYSNYFNAWWKRDLQAMVLRDRNHPSIFMWSIGNEIPEREDPDAVNTAKMLSEEIKKIDTSRPITSAIVNGGKNWDIFDPLMAQHDVAGYNYSLDKAPQDHIRVPSRIIVQTESYPKDAFKNWELVQKNKYIIGDFVWTAMDYLGESGIGRYYYSGEVHGEHWENDFFPWHGAYCGDIDLIGWRKPIAHYRGMLYNEKEKLYMAVREPAPEPLEIKQTWWSVYPTWESWTWTEYTGKNVEVEVYSKYPKVKLYLNGQLLGEKQTGEKEEFKAVFTVPYASGTLRAVGVANEKEEESVTLKTAGEAVQIKLAADRKEIKADGQDLTYIAVELLDREGVLNPNADGRLTFKIQGPGSIQAIDNANLKDFEPYQSLTRKAWHGRALAILRSTHEKGEIKLTVSGDGLQPQTITIASNN